MAKLRISPNALTKRFFEKEGILYDDGQRRVGNVSKDLFGFGDVIAVMQDATLLVQACRRADIATRTKKITDDPLVNFKAQLWLQRPSRWIQVWGWKHMGKGVYEAATRYVYPTGRLGKEAFEVQVGAPITLETK